MFPSASDHSQTTGHSCRLPEGYNPHFQYDFKQMPRQFLLVNVKRIPYQFFIYPFTNKPEAVKSESTQLPFTLAPGFKADAPSFLSFNAQLA